MEIIRGRGRSLIPIGGFIGAANLALFLLMIICVVADDHHCTSSCGDVRNITSPFRLETDPLHCGDLRYNLSCENNTTVLYFYSDEEFPAMDPPKRYFVQAINYDNYTIRLVDPEIREGNCSSIPGNTLSRSRTFFLDWNPYIYEPEIRSGFLRQASMSGNPKATFKNTRVISQTVIFFTCEKPVNSSNYIESPCVFKGNCSFSSSSSSSLTESKKRYSYYSVMDDGFSSSDLVESCCIEQMSLISTGENSTKPRNSLNIYNAIVHGFELSWVQSFDKRGNRLCYVNDKNPKKVSCLSGCSFIDYRVSFGCNPFHTFLAYLQLYLSIESMGDTNM